MREEQEQGEVQKWVLTFLLNTILREAQNAKNLDEFIAFLKVFMEKTDVPVLWEKKEK